MKVIAELTYDDEERNRTVEVELKDSLKGASILNALDRHLQSKKFGDPDWTHWSLVDIKKDEDG